MKNILKINLLLVLVLVLGCNKAVEIAPEEKPEQRMKAVLEELKTNILKSPYGWKAELATAENNGFSFYFNFDDKDRVVSISDINNESSEVPFESGYRLRAVMGPSLLFDTYSYIHLLADPNKNVAGGVVAKGYSSDFEFEYNGVSADSMVFVGKKQRSFLRLVPATQEEKMSYLNGEFKIKIDNFSNFISDNENIYFQIPGSETRYSISFNKQNKKSKIRWLEENEVKSVEGPYAYTLTGIKFIKNLKLGDLYLSHLDLVSSVSGKLTNSQGASYEVVNSSLPIIPLFKEIGVAYSVFNVPGPRITTVPLQTWGSDYITRYNSFKNAIKTGDYNFDLEVMKHTFFPARKQVEIFIDIYQRATRFVAGFIYDYEVTEDGLFKFRNRRNHTINGNAASIATDHNLIDERFGKDDFIIQYILDPNKGLVAEFRSMQNPEFYFTALIDNL